MKTIIYSDLDGTLFSRNHKGETYINESNFEALLEYRKDSKNYFGIATGRNIPLLDKHLHQTDIVTNLPFILMNGSVIYDSINKNILYNNTLSHDVINEALKYQEENNDVILFLISPYTRYSVVKYDINQPYELVTKENLDYNNINKLSFVVNNETTYNKRLNDIKAFKTSAELEVTPSGATFIEVVNKDVSKYSGINKVLELKGLDNSKSRIITIGDHLNDYMMVKNAHISFCPSNAVKEIKEIADYIVSSSEESAILDMLEILKIDSI